MAPLSQELEPPINPERFTFNKAISLRGAAPPNRVVLIQFPDMDALKAIEAKEQQIQTDVGVDKYASYRVIGIEGIEQK